MVAVIAIIPVGIFIAVFIVSLIGFCRSNHYKKKNNELPMITINGGRKRASVSSYKTYHQDGGHGLATHTNNSDGGGAAVMTGAAVLAAAAALDGGGGDSGGGGG
ncbi:hypothetical protein M9H77_21551 [Catharanthus roseus]|uniref:Uncharacterized protein n=1 Tax=Catharanthus roseus TaxID=4058 RepID=A0ACC0AS09_CATRO|nr:hypothetical protein M9H77_21551 [Catharanthus roseus]